MPTRQRPDFARQAARYFLAQDYPARELLVLEDGEPSLAGTARPVVARMSQATAAEAGVADGDKVTVATDRGSVTVPAEVVPMADHVVWLPAAGLPGGATIRTELGAGHGAMVTLRRPQ